MFSEWKLGFVFILSLWYYLTIPHGGLWYVHAHDSSQVVFGWGVLSFVSSGMGTTGSTVTWSSSALPRENSACMRLVA